MPIVSGNRGRRPYPPEFKREAVEPYRRSGTSIKTIAGELGVATESLRAWNKQQAIDAGERPGLSSREREELAELRRKLRRVEQERDLLKRAVAFFARETESGERVPVHLGGEGPHPGLDAVCCARV
jgi:transposase